MSLTPQQERVLAKARTAAGVCQVDFLLPDVCDGGTPITRVGARLHELDGMGYGFENLGWRSRTKVFRVCSEPDAACRDGAEPLPSPSPVPAGSLFDVPVGKPEKAHWQDAA